MASMKEIQDRIASIKDTLKITNAMYMISSAKMKRAQRVLKESLPYFYGIQDAVNRVLRHMSRIEHPYFDQRPEKRAEDRIRAYFVVAADKGMAGAYVHNVIRMTEEELEKPGIHKLYILGELGHHYFGRKGLDLNTDFRYTVQRPTLHQARLMAETVMEEFSSGNVDEFYMIYTSMQSAASMQTQCLSLLPLHKTNFDPDLKENIGAAAVRHENIAMNPSADAVLDAVVPNYLIGIIYGCLVQSYSSEHNSRMMAMEASTKSANKMLKELSVKYNRARQAAITQEITEVISGAKAQKRKKR